MQYIGFDTHKRYTFYTQMDATGAIQRQGRLMNSRDAMAEFFRVVTEPRVVIEASMNWYHLYDLLEALGVPVTLAHPSRTRAIAEAKVKTDKVDSTILAHLLRTDLVPPAYIPPRAIRDLRELLRYRAALVRFQTMIKNRVHAILLKHGYQCPFTDAFGVQGRAWLATLPSPSSPGDLATRRPAWQCDPGLPGSRDLPDAFPPVAPPLSALRARRTAAKADTTNPLAAAGDSGVGACGPGLRPAVAHARPGAHRPAVAAAPVGRLAHQRLGGYAILRRHGLQTCWERLTRLEAHAATDGLLTERTRRHLGRPHVEAQRPGDLVCLDAFYIGKLKGVGKVWQLTACDAACSYGIVTLVRQVTQQATSAFLRTRVLPAYERAGHRIQAVLTDGGPEWQGRFAAACRELGITHRRPRPRHAWTNGFVERLQGTILTELWRVAFRRTYYRSIGQLDQDLQAYLRFYNLDRPHQPESGVIFAGPMATIAR
jgi:transposase InsO family protein